MESKLITLEDLPAEAEQFVASLTPKEHGATLVTLSGELGAGKTTFSQAVAKSLGVTERVTSPTFVLMKRYELPEGRTFKTFFHIDAYRLSEGDLAHLWFDEIMSDKDTLVFLEWPECVGADTWKVPHQKIRFEVVSDTERTLTYGKND